MQSGSVSTAAFDGAAEASIARGTGRRASARYPDFCPFETKRKEGPHGNPGAAPARGADALSGLRRTRRQQGRESAAAPQPLLGRREGVGRCAAAPREGARRLRAVPPHFAAPWRRAARRAALPRRGGRGDAAPRRLRIPLVLLIPPASGGGGVNIDERVA